MSYKFIDTENIEVFDYEDCVFVVGDQDNIYSITKSEDKYCFVDFGASDAQYYQNNLNQNFGNFINAKHNKVTGKSFYTVVVNENDKLIQSDVFMDNNKMDFVKTYITAFPDPFPNKVNLYSNMLEGELLEQFDTYSEGAMTTFHIS